MESNNKGDRKNEWKNSEEIEKRSQEEEKKHSGTEQELSFLFRKIIEGLRRRCNDSRHTQKETKG